MEELLINLAGFGSKKMEDIGFLSFLTLMIISFLSSLFISFLYVKFYKARATGSQVHRAFPLIGLSITAIFISIQFSLPLSLGLLGALSIVRFRTPIKEPEEIGFIMLVVASSLCCATFNMSFLAILMIVAVAALFVMKYSRVILKGRMNDGMLIITMPTNDYHTNMNRFLELLEKRIPHGRIDSITDNHNESVISYSFIRINQDTLIEFQNDLKKFATSARSNIFFNRQGEI